MTYQTNYFVFQDKESWDMDTAEKIEAAGKKKEEGNALFKAGKYLRASRRYEKVNIWKDGFSCFTSMFHAYSWWLT